MRTADRELLICNLRAEASTLHELLVHLEHAQTLPAEDREMLRYRIRHVAKNLTQLERSFPAAASN